jgi:hypothetical protein
MACTAAARGEEESRVSVALTVGFPPPRCPARAMSRGPPCPSLFPAELRIERGVSRSLLELVTAESGRSGRVNDTNER